MSDEGKNIKNGSYYVFNLNNSNQRGSHWVALYKGKNKSYYFDSYGFYCDKEIEPFIKPYIYNKKQIQNYNSSSCGFFCIAYIYFMYHNNNNLNGFINMFSDDTRLNDYILYRYLKKNKLVY